MSQAYVDPNGIEVPEGTPRPTRRLKDALKREGQIVPLLVFRNRSGTRMVAADRLQGERLLALRELGWETVLTEDEWEEDDLW